MAGLLLRRPHLLCTGRGYGVHRGLHALASDPEKPPLAATATPAKPARVSPLRLGGAASAYRADAWRRLALGREAEGTSSDRTPRSLWKAQEASSSADLLGKHVLGARVRAAGRDGPLWELDRPLPEEVSSEQVEKLRFSDALGRSMFWHSSAHVLGWAVEAFYGDSARLTDGPPVPSSEGATVAPGMGGFFYEFDLRDDPSSDVKQRVVTPSDLAALEKICNTIVNSKAVFTRAVLTREEARELFARDKEKLEILDKIPESEVLTAYKLSTPPKGEGCFEFIDLCRGPHLPTLEPVGSLKLLRAGTSTSEGGRVERTRIYGTSFPSIAEYKDWTARTELAASRDHRLVGAKQKLFVFHESSPGSAFTLPHGTIVHNRLVNMLRDEYSVRGFQEVMTPQIFKASLWGKSGHLAHYADDMFFATRGLGKQAAQAVQCEHHHPPHASEDDELLGVKPMNCPAHCVMFSLSGARSYRDLPVRFADFGALHRNEISGSLGGLTRLRRFHQDDAHIFCTEDQVETEIADCLNFLSSVYGERFGFHLKVELSTRPEKSSGTDAMWAKAEAALESALRRSLPEFGVKPGDGAFYGPKIDVSVTDALGRSHQCGTIQLDFNMPEKFELEYVDKEGQKQRPVMIHRAVLGSLERFTAILLENAPNGKLPFWLSPRQVAVVPVTHAGMDPLLSAYAHRVASSVRRARGSIANASTSELTADVLDSTDSLLKRVRNAHAEGYAVTVVVGTEEMESDTVSVRGAPLQQGSKEVTSTKISLQAFLEACARSSESRVNEIRPAGL